MKRLLLTGLLALIPYGADAQDWSANPSQPSLLLLVSADVAKPDNQLFQPSRDTDLWRSTSFLALLEYPAAPKTNVIIRAAYTRQENNTLAVARPTATGPKRVLSLGFGLRFLWGK